jgi:hypothetical protein
MGNINDRNDPYYSSQSGWRWVDQLGSWVDYGSNNPANQAAEQASRELDAARAAAQQANQQASQAKYGWSWTDNTGRNRVNNITGEHETYDPNAIQQQPGLKVGQIGVTSRGGFVKAPKSANEVPKSANEVPSNAQIIGAAKPSAFAEKARGIAMDRAMGGGLPTNALSTSDAERARGAQMSMLEQLLKQARGEADSPAQMMLQQAADRNLSDASAMAASQRGLGATAAASQVAGQRAQIGQEAARDAGILRLQEQMQATQAASRVAEGLRGQDIAQEQARAQVALASDSLRESLKQKYLQMGMDSAEADRRANMEMTALQTQAGLGMGRMELERSLGMGRLDLERSIADRKFANEDREFWMNLIGNIGKMAVGFAGA